MIMMTLRVARMENILNHSKLYFAFQIQILIVCRSLALQSPQNEDQPITAMDLWRYILSLDARLVVSINQNSFP
jgi:hypothetical protein